MAEFPRKLKLIYSANSIDDLGEIWDWNAAQHGETHANQYLEFLKKHILRIVESKNPGKEVPTRDSFRYLVIKRRNRGYGHIIIFQIEEESMLILHYYHTAQDWQTKIDKEK